MISLIAVTGGKGLGLKIAYRKIKIILLVKVTR
jgi:hypothetical protein